MSAEPTDEGSLDWRRERSAGDRPSAVLACMALIAVLVVRLVPHRPRRRLPAGSRAGRAVLAGGAGSARRVAAGVAGGARPLAHPRRPRPHRPDASCAPGRARGRAASACTPASIRSRRSARAGLGRAARPHHLRRLDADHADRPPAEPHRRTFGGQARRDGRARCSSRRGSPSAQILALYLTLAPYGGNLEGVRAASLAYFGHEPASLTNGEQALLIALPQSPEARRPDRHPAAARAARGRGAGQDGARRPDRRRPPRRGGERRARCPAAQRFPALAWHAAGELARAAPRGPGLGASPPSTPTCSAAWSPWPRRPPRDQGAGRRGRHPGGARSRTGRCAPRSARRASTAPGGWIDMTRALRSPGSALKPFIYGLAFDDGIVAARHRARRRAAPLRRLPAGGLRPRLPRPGHRARGADLFAERAGGRHARPDRGRRRSRRGSQAPARAWCGPTPADRDAGPGAGAGRRGDHACATSPCSTPRWATTAWPSRWPGPRPTPRRGSPMPGHRLMRPAAARASPRHPARGPAAEGPRAGAP